MIEIDAPGRADDLVASLANAFLTGTAYDDDTVHIVDLHGSDPEDVIDELAAYADRLGITDARIVTNLSSPQGEWDEQ